MTEREPPRGPFEDNTWPAKLAAHAVRPGARPLLHGYDVQDDLAKNYRFGEIVLTALTGEAPAPEQGAAFEIALAFWLPVSAGEAAVHAAIVARMNGAHLSGALATGAIGLCEHARVVVERNSDVLAWLAEPSAPLPERARATNDEERAAVDRLHARLVEAGTEPVTRALDAGLEAALIATLAVAGLRAPAQLLAALVQARLPVVAAEAAATTVAAFQSYPARLPDLEYREDETP